jgi:hypothetical protein
VGAAALRRWVMHNPTGQRVFLSVNPRSCPNPTERVLFFSFRFLFLPMISHSFVFFFCYINETRAILCVVRKKKDRLESGASVFIWSE